MLHKVIEEQTDQLFSALELLWAYVWVLFIICVAHAVESYIHLMWP